MINRMAARDKNEYIDVKIEDIQARTQREQRLAEIEARKQEITKQIELAEKERIKLLKEAEKAAKTSETVIPQKAKNDIQSSPYAGQRATFPSKSAVVTDTKQSVPASNEMPSANGPFALLCGFVVAAIGARVALENRDEKQEEIMASKVEKFSTTGISTDLPLNISTSENKTVSENCTHVITDFFLGKKVVGAPFNETNFNNEKGEKKYTVVSGRDSTKAENRISADETIVEIAEKRAKGDETRKASDALASEQSTADKALNYTASEKINETNVEGDKDVALNMDAGVDILPAVENVVEDEVFNEKQASMETELDMQPPVIEDQSDNEIPQIETKSENVLDDELPQTKYRGSAYKSGLFSRISKAEPQVDALYSKGAEKESSLPITVKILGIGDGGSYAINNMHRVRNTPGIEFWSVNTDLKSLEAAKQRGSRAFAIGPSVTQGNGAGGDPGVGEIAAIESSGDITRMIKGSNVCILTSGLGSGTGSGAAPIISKLAKDCGALTIAVVTEPFPFEGKKRKRQAVTAIDQLFDRADCVIVISDENVLEIIPEETSLEMSFQVVDEIVNQVVIGLTDLFSNTGILTVEYGSLSSIFKGSGFAVVGLGTGNEETAAEDAAYAAISSPLLNAPLDKARGIVVNIVGGKALSAQKIDQVKAVVEANVNPDATVLVGAQVNEILPDNTVSVTVIATAFKVKE